MKVINTRMESLGDESDIARGGWWRSRGRRWWIPTAVDDVWVWGV